jgi:hypothetical protein
MIIWTGRGIVVFFIFLAACVGAIMLTVSWIEPRLDLHGDQGFHLSLALGALLSAILTYPLDRFMMKQPADRTAVDPKTSQTYVVRNRDSLFGIETRYWTYVFAGLAVVMLVVTFLF